jgi:hypothetical protein
VVEAVLTDVSVDVLAQRTPLTHRTVQSVPFDGEHSPVHACPGHHLRVHVRLFRAAHLPQAPVRVLPMALEEVQQRALQVPCVLRRRDARVAGEMEGVEHLPPDVELELPGGGIADPYRSGSLVAREPRQVVLGQPSSTVQPVHDAQL